MGILSGHSRETSILLLSIMGVFFGLCALGISVELFLRKSGKRFSKPVPFRKYIRTPGGGGWNWNIKKVGVLVVSLRGVNFRFWSRLGC